jgi:hypothetical protein
MSTYSASRRVIGSSHPLDGRLGATVGVWYPRYHGPPVMAQNFGPGRFLLAANGWGTIDPIPNTAPPLLTEEEGPPI